MVQLTRPLLKYIPEWYHLRKGHSSYFKKQAQLYLTRYYKNIGWSSIKNARNRYEYLLKGEMFYASRVRNHKRDINRSRIAAACEQHGFKYQHLMSTLPKLNINLDLYALSRLAIYEPRTFKSLVDIAKEATSECLEMANFDPQKLNSRQDFRTSFVPEPTRV